MKVLYVAYKHDPLNPHGGSGADYQLYSALVNNGIQTKILGPFDVSGNAIEQLMARSYTKMTKNHYTRFHYSVAKEVARQLEGTVESFRPQVILTMYPTSLAYYRGSVPSVYRVDTTYKAAFRHYKYGHGRIGQRLMEDIQNKALKRASSIITHSSWAANCLKEDLGIPESNIHVFPNPAALPAQVIPTKIDEVSLDLPIRLLFVGRDPRRKNLDTAIQVAKILNEKGTSARLTVCGIEGRDCPYITYVGTFRKDDPKQLEQYTNFYRSAHLLIHPAVFDPSPIVTSEAAAFGTPTITNAVGGIATSVKDGISGVVLPANSPAEAYVAEIKKLINDPKRYTRLRRTTRKRFEDELNWEVAGQKLMQILDTVVNDACT